MKKDKQFSIRISKQDLETIRRKAAQAHMSQSDYVTSCCLGKKIIIIDGLKEVLRQQKAIGNNLNQLTVLANMLEMQERLFRQQMQLDADLKTLLTKQDAQEALTEMQMSAAEFKRQAGSLSARYSSACKELTESTQKAVTTISESGRQAILTIAQAAKQKIRLCGWISITAVILCATLCSLAVLWSR